MRSMFWMDVNGHTRVAHHQLYAHLGLCCNNRNAACVRGNVAIWFELWIWFDLSFVCGLQKQITWNSLSPSLLLWISRPHKLYGESNWKNICMCSKNEWFGIIFNYIRWCCIPTNINCLKYASTMYTISCIGCNHRLQNVRCQREIPCSRVYAVKCMRKMCNTDPLCRHLIDFHSNIDISGA